MHGLVFETSICGWQDQPGSGVRSRRKDRGTCHVCDVPRAPRAGPGSAGRTARPRAAAEPRHRCHRYHRCVVLSCRVGSFPSRSHDIAPEGSSVSLLSRTSYFASPPQQPHATNDFRSVLRTSHFARISRSLHRSEEESPLRRRVNGGRTSTTSAGRKPMSQSQPHTGVLAGSEAVRQSQTRVPGRHRFGTRNSPTHRHLPGRRHLQVRPGAARIGGLRK